MGKRKIRVLIADDHQIMLDGLVSVLKNDAPHIEVVYIANNGQEVIEFLRLHREGVDVAVLDIEMPQMDGVETAKKIRERYDQVKVLILTMYKDERFVTQLAKEGISGYVLKSHGRTELIHAIEKVHGGETYYDQKITEILLQDIQKSKSVKLTNREGEVLTLIGEGLTTPQISKKLCIAKTTVDTYRKNLIEKLGVSNTKGLVRYAVEHKYV